SGFDHEEHAQHIRVELTVKFLLAELLEGRKREDARVVYEHIQAAEGFFRLRDEALCVGPLRHAASYGDGSPAFAGDFAHHPFRAFMIARIVHNHRRAFRAESFAMPAPIPFEAPVTIATLLSSRFMMCSFVLAGRCRLASDG